MNEFAKRMALGFLLALLVAGFIGYGGMKQKAMPLYAGEVNQPSLCAVFIQGIRIFEQDILPATVADDYYSRIYSPLPIAFCPTDERPF